MVVGRRNDNIISIVLPTGAKGGKRVVIPFESFVLFGFPRTPLPPTHGLSSSCVRGCVYLRAPGVVPRGTGAYLASSEKFVKTATTTRRARVVRAPEHVCGNRKLLIVGSPANETAFLIRKFCFLKICSEMFCVTAARSGVHVRHFARPTPVQ